MLITYDKDTNKSKLQYSDELKFGYKICDYCNILTRIKRDGEIKHYFDFGDYKVFGVLFNLYSSIKLTKDFAANWVRLGVGYKKDKFLTENRIERDYGGNYNLSSKMFF